MEWLILEYPDPERFDPRKIEETGASRTAGRIGRYGCERRLVFPATVRRS